MILTQHTTGNNPVNRNPIFSTYLNNLAAVARQGDAREESFYPALADMLKEMATATGKTDVHVTTLPRATEGGNPDFRLWNGTDRIIGYVEAKKPTEERLDSIEKIRTASALPRHISKSHSHQLS